MISIILISVVLVFVIIFLVNIIAKNRKLEKKYKSLDVIFNNLHSYAFLINDSVGVEQTNYYALNPDAKNDQPLILGNVLRCKNGCDAGCCGTSPNCAACTIRSHIIKALQTKTGFANVETHMQLYTPNHNVVEADVNVGGTYVEIQNRPHLVIDVKDITPMKTLQRMYLEEKQKLQVETSHYRAVIIKMIKDISAPVNTIINYFKLFSSAKTEQEREGFAKFIDNQGRSFKTRFEKFFSEDMNIKSDEVDSLNLKVLKDLDITINNVLPIIYFGTSNDIYFAKIKDYLKNIFNVVQVYDVYKLVANASGNIKVNAVIIEDAFNESLDNVVSAIEGVNNNLPIIVLAKSKENIGKHGKNVFCFDKNINQTDFIQNIELIKV